MSYNNIYLKNFKITEEEIIQPEKIAKLSKQYKFIHYKWQPRICGMNGYGTQGDPKLLFNDKKIYFELGDHSFTQDIYDRVNKNNIILATNNEVFKKNVYSLPIGVTSTSHCKVIGNIDIIVDQFKKPKQYNEKLIYMNFKIKNPCRGKIERETVARNFINKDYVTLGKHIRNNDGHKIFIENIYNHKFVLCPRGNGVDTHRLWMTLYLGSIPIVRMEKVLEPFKHLPILFVNDWNEITPDFLKKKYEEIHNKKYDFSVLTMSYWKKLCIPLLS
jgi:hypothetical protein